MEEVIDRFPSNGDLLKWREDYTDGYLVNKKAEGGKKLHTAACIHSKPDVPGDFTHWMASEDRAKLTARAEELHREIAWAPLCKHCVGKPGHL